MPRVEAYFPAKARVWWTIRAPVELPIAVPESDPGADMAGAGRLGLRHRHRPLQVRDPQGRLAENLRPVEIAVAAGEEAEPGGFVLQRLGEPAERAVGEDHLGD